MINNFTEFLNVRKKRTWESFIAVVDGFLGNTGVDNFKELIEKTENLCFCNKVIFHFEKTWTYHNKASVNN